MKRLLTVFILALSFQFSAHGQITWTKKSGPYGGNVGDIVVHPTNFTVYAIAGNGSNNATSGSLYRSTDNGNTWAKQKLSVFGSDTSFFTDVKILPNGWIYLLSSPDYNMGNNNVAGNDLFKSTDDGVTWTKLNTGTNGTDGGFEYGIEVAVNPSTNTVYVSSAYRDQNDNVFVKWFRSTNGGTTFLASPSVTDNSSGYDFRQIAITSTGDVYAIRHYLKQSGSGSPQLWKSVSDGASFTNQTASNIPETSTSSPAFLTSKADNSELFIVMGASNMFTLSTPFTTWASLIETNIADANYGGQSVIGYSPDGASQFLQDNQNHKFYSRLTSSAGNTWTQKTTTFLNSNNDRGASFAAKDASTLYVGASIAGIWKSTNGGTGWAESDNLIEAGNNGGIVAADNGNLVVIGAIGYLSTDQGNNWSRITGLPNNGPNYTLFKATTGSPKPIVAMSSFGNTSYKSVDNGVTWSSTGVAPNAFNYTSSDGTKILGYSGTQFFYTSDQGATWSSALSISGTGWPAGNFNVGDVAIDQSGNFFVSFNSTSLFKVVLNSATSPTTGTATQINLSSVGPGLDQTHGITYLNGKFFISGHPTGGGQEPIISTSDLGSTWTTLATNVNTNHLYTDVANNYLFAVQNNGKGYYTIQLSRDEGATFSSSFFQTSFRSSFYGVALNSSGVAFLGLSNSSIFSSLTTIVTPAAPTSLVNSGAGTDRATLRWIDNATNEKRFVVAQFNGVSYDTIGSLGINATTGAKLFFEVKHLQPNTSYSFQVYATNAAGNSPVASVSFSTLSSSCASSIPDNRSWNGTVNWSNSTPASGSTALTNVNIKSLGSGFYSITDISNGAMSGQSTTIPGQFLESCNSTYLLPISPAQPNTNGTWTSGSSTLVLKWITKNGVSPESIGTATLTVNASDPTPGTPTNATAYVYSNSSIEISWVSSTYAAQYVVERATNNTFTTGLTALSPVSNPATSIIDNDPALVLNTTYYYRVKAKNTTGVFSAVSTTATILFAKPTFTLSGTAIESTPGYSSPTAIWGDFDGDGFDDLIISQLTFVDNTASVPYAFKNNGNGTFTSVSLTGITPSLYTTGSAVDYDNDGKLDIFFGSGGSQNSLYKGNGNFTFSLVNSPVISQNYANAQKGFDLGIAWADYNNDGLVDLIETNNDNTKLSRFFVQSPVGTFTKQSSGLLSSIMVSGATTIWGDFDNNGYQDVFITDQNSSTTKNLLYKNNGDGTFTSVVTAPFSTDINEKSFTASWGDYNNDTYLDLFISAQNNNLLYKNNGNGSFTKQSMNTSVTEPQGSTAGFSSAWGDINNDGYLDLMVANAGIESYIYINNSGTSFTKVSGEKFNDIKGPKLSIALSDYNQDGLLDLAASSVDPTIFGNTPPEVILPNRNYYLFKNNTASTNNWIEIKLDGVTSNKLGIGARVTLVAGGKTQVREVTTSNGFGSQNSRIVHFGLGASSTITSLQIKWPSGATQTITDQTYLTPKINHILPLTEDGTPPQAILLNPLHNATNVPLNTPIEITFDESFTVVAGKKINVFIQGSGSPAFTLDVSTGTIVGNKISFTPSSPLIQQTIYDLTIDAGAFQDIYGNATPARSAGTWVFVSHDTQAPVITYTPPATFDNGFSSQQISVPITDNSGTVASAKLSYRKIAGGTFTDLAGIDGGAGSWNFTVQESFFDGNGMECSFSATDADGNTSRLPLDPSTTFYIYKNYPEANNLIPSAQLGFGGAISNWKIFTIPFDLGSNNAVNVVFDELTSLTVKKDWRMVTYDQVSKTWDDYPDFSVFTRGVGYFINIKTQATIKVPTVASSTYNRNKLFKINLKAGWNQIGNPYLTPIDWSDVVTINSLSGKAAALKIFSNGSYGTGTTLAPWQGGFVFADNDVSDVLIPFQGQHAIGGRQGATHTNTPVVFSADDWIVPLALTNGDIENTFGGIGMHSAASLSYDQFDDINAPRFIEYLEMNFPHPEDISKHFARDVVPQSNEYTWEFTIDSNIKGQTELKWGNSSGLSKDIYLYDIKREMIVNMKDRSSYSFNGQGSSQFRIYYGDNIESKIKPETISLGDAYPNPSGNYRVTVPFTLPGSSSQYQVSLEVYDMLGQKVTTLVNASLAAGFYSAQWEPGQELQSGMYLYRIKVAGQGNSSVLSKKLIVNH